MAEAIVHTHLRRTTTARPIGRRIRPTVTAVTLVRRRMGIAGTHLPLTAIADTHLLPRLGIVDIHLLRHMGTADTPRRRMGIEATRLLPTVAVLEALTPHRVATVAVVAIVVEAVPAEASAVAGAPAAVASEAAVEAAAPAVAVEVEAPAVAVEAVDHTVAEAITDLWISF